MEVKDYLDNYLAAYKELRIAATEKMKNRGSELDVREYGKRLLMLKNNYTSEDEIYDDEFDDWFYSNVYSCVFAGKHDILYCAYITKVRYNTELDELEVYLESDDGYVNDWYSESWVGWDRDAIFITIMEYSD